MATSIEAMVRLRAMTVDDLRAAQSLSNAKKWPHRIEDWDMLLSLGFGYVAENEDGIVGTAMAWLYGADAATLGMVIVSPQVSEPGVEQRLMDAVLGDLDGRTVLLSAPGETAEQLFAGMGFAPIGSVFQHQGAAFSVPIAALLPEERVRPLGAKDMPVLYDLARRASGMDRDALLDALVPGAQAVVLTRDHDPVGFSLFRRFGRGHVIGPTVAPDAGGAKALISHWLGSHASSFCRLDISEDSGLGEWLEELGLPRVGQVTRMARGRPPEADPSIRTFTLTTQALG